jgi:hypothetical protein
MIFPIVTSTQYERCDWIVRVEPGHGFPYTEFPIHNRPHLEAVQKNIHGKWHAYIRDTRDVPYPPEDLKDFRFGEIAGPAYDNGPFSKSYDVPKGLWGMISSSGITG